eukprot:PLAT5812.1.p1 GENE.PLAT5812.1~~PLAT5812.1.p1  ORF type:complete len:221 (+),score=86.65 PLAT5812.1:3-665(+)
MTLFAILTYLAGYLFLVFATICLASGLYYLAELAEEHVALTKRLISWAIKIICGLHAALWLVDGIPLFQTTVGIGTHVVFSSLLLDYPWLELTSPTFLLSISCLMVDHWVWMRFLTGNSYSTPQVFGFFFLFVWMVPFSFFVSLSINDNMLPGGGAARRPAASAKRASMFRAIYDALKSRVPRRWLPASAAASELPISSSGSSGSSGGSGSMKSLHGKLG